MKDDGNKSYYKNALRKKESYIAATEIEDRIIGFCKVDINGEIGILDYLVVKEKFRGKGFVKELMDWAINFSFMYERK
ncbi:N-acetyltransferase [Butyrivibrio sp. X503]|uniref:GNAT family N-acetyltransferase n=1 Tax=Butyrivibrio sp. X503 TaxID=2364878 RepID=UPI000EA9DFC2|nr:GNAT family N-acetyltransferase [Butyrivibrio sp. X503]RKM55206.1 N-acetyltransferase [Butyrivibrio sp. X503]